MAKVAFIGLGVMGFPMAGHLVKKGQHEVTVYNRTAATAKAWTDKFGGRAAPTPKAAAEGQDFVMACVGNDNDLRSVTLGDNGAFAGMKKDAIFVDRGEVVGGERLVLARQAAREWRIRALAGSAGASALSSQLAHIGVAFDRVRSEGEVAYVALDRDEDAADVLARLVRAGVAITHFAPAVGDIERTYLSLAGGAR